MTPVHRHVALVGFMGSGKSTLGSHVAARIGSPLTDIDADLEGLLGPIADYFREHGETAFRGVEESAVTEALLRKTPSVVVLGGGAVASLVTRGLLGERATTLWLDVDVETCWERVRGGDRPLAQNHEDFRRLYEERRSLYDEVADALVRDADDAVLAAAGVHVERGAIQRLGELVPGDGAVALVSDPHVAGIHGMDAQLALGARLAETHELPPGEEAKSLATLDRLSQELRLDRSGTIVALGGGAATDAAGLAAAIYLRGIPWVPVPTTLVGQVDAAIGGKTAIDIPQGKNLVGAFHWPARTVIDPALLETLPDAQRREGLAEVVKTGLLAGERVWELPDADLVRRCALFKTAVCLRDPEDRGERAVLNLGHTFAHALETAAGYDEITHGEAVALGLGAALRLSVEHLGLDPAVAEDADRVLAPKPARVGLERAWAALGRDKKGEGGRVMLVLLEAPGKPVHGVELPDEDVRQALESLVA